MSAKGNREISYFYVFASVVLWIITIVWMVFIFRMSSESGEDSSERSKFYLDVITSITGKKIISEYTLRKVSHVIEYSILAILAFLAIRFTNKISEKTSYAESRVKIIKSDNEMYIIMSLWLSSLFAIVDEYHQLFVSGRNGSILDVAIDFAGIVITLIIIRLAFSLYLRKIGKEEVRYD